MCNYCAAHVSTFQVLLNLKTELGSDVHSRVVMLKIVGVCPSEYRVMIVAVNLSFQCNVEFCCFVIFIEQVATIERKK